MYDTFQYVSVVFTLRSLLQNTSNVRVLLIDRSKSGFLLNFEDGQSHASHYVFSDSSKLTAKFQLFYDGVGTTNPLRGQSVMCSMGVFCYNVKNLLAF